MWNPASGLEGRVAIVTGAAGGIGQACLDAFSTAGARLVACDRDPQLIDRVGADLSDPSRPLTVVADLGQPEAAEHLVDEVLRRCGRVDVLVNAAGVHLRLPFEEIDEWAWQEYLNANVKSQFYVSRAVARPMSAARWGRIINFSSLAAYTGGYRPETSVAYASTKGAVLTMTRSLSRLLAPHNILVNAIAPGGVRTPMATTLSEQDLATYARDVPLGRLAEAHEIAAAALFLASDHASYITGAVIDINGGSYNH